MLCLSGFELYARWVPLAVPEVADAQPVSVLSRCVCIFSLAFCFAVFVASLHVLAVL